MSSEDICLWADGTWCYLFELEEMNHMSEDYEIIPVDSPRYEDVRCH
jgi:hypothetical protein